MSPSRLPLQVYLDSSDFSNLSDPVKREPFVEVERCLIAWRDAGLIELRFSFAHVAEFAPVGPEHLPFARMRADYITWLCGSNVLKAPSDLIKSEVKTFAGKSAWMRDHALDGGGNWMPSSFRENIELPTMLEVVTDAMTNEPLNREQRRKLKQRYLEAGGKLNGDKGSG